MRCFDSAGWASSKMARVFRFVNDTHSVAEFFDDAVMGDRLSQEGIISGHVWHILFCASRQVKRTALTNGAYRTNERGAQVRVRSAYRAVHPPSIKIVSPVINDAAGEARNTTAPATSIGSPIRCSAAIRSNVSA